MGLPLPAWELLLGYAADTGGLAGPALTLGVLDVEVPRREVLEAVRRVGVGCAAAALESFRRRPPDERPAATELLALLGCDPVETLDLFPGEGATILHDLCQPVPATLVGRFGLVVDGGTMEHVFDVASALENLVRLLRPGGVIAHLSPVSGWENHGFYCLNPKLLARTYGANGFTRLRASLLQLPRDPTRRPHVERCPSLDQPFVCDSLRYRTTLVLFGRRGADSSPFVPPVDTHLVLDGAATSRPAPVAPVAPPEPGQAAGDRLPLPSWNIHHDRGHAYIAALPAPVEAGRLYEDDVPLAGADSLHDVIRREGGGLYSFWTQRQGYLFFSTSDNSDPLTNGRRYSYEEVAPSPGPERRLAWHDDEELSSLLARARAVCGEAPADACYALKELLLSLGTLEADTAACGLGLALSSLLVCHYSARMPRASETRHRTFGAEAPGSDPAALRELLGDLEAVVEHRPAPIPSCFEEGEALRFSFAHVDLREREPLRAALDYFCARLVAGGALLIGGYGLLDHPGVREAVDTVLGGRPGRLLRLPTGQVCFIRGS